MRYVRNAKMTHDSSAATTPAMPGATVSAGVCAWAMEPVMRAGAIRQAMIVRIVLVFRIAPSPANTPLV